MFETLSNFLRSRSAEDARTDSSSDANIVDETQKEKNDLSQSLLSEFLQTAPAKLQRSGSDVLLASNTEVAPSFASAVGGADVREPGQDAREPAPPGAGQNRFADAAEDKKEPPPPGAQRPATDVPPAAQPPGGASLADVIEGKRQTPKIESMNINGTPVKVKSVDFGPDRSRVVVLGEEYGVHPANSKITFYDKEIFPQGKRTPHGNVTSVAEHPRGTKVFTKVNGNVLYELATPLKVEDRGGTFEGKVLEELPNGTQMWRTTGGSSIEKLAKDSLTTSKGTVERIEWKDGKLNYLTQDLKAFSVEEQGGKLVVTDFVDGKPGQQTKVDSFAEKFNPPLNHPYYGAVLSRTRTPDAVVLDLGQRGECKIFLQPKKYDGTRTTHSVIRDSKDGSTKSYLSDGSIVYEQPGTKDRDVVKVESMADQTQRVFYKNGDSTTKFSNGDRTEKYVDGLATSLDGKVVEVQRSKAKNVYLLADGGKVEMKLKVNEPLVKTTKDGAAQIMKESSVREHFASPQPTAYGAIKGLETKNTGETSYYLADTKEYQKITLLGTPRNDYKGYVTYPDGTNRLILSTGRILPTTMTMSQSQIDGLMNNELKPSQIPNLNAVDMNMLFRKRPNPMPGPPELIPDVLELFRK